jgi:hypothetical protein
MTELGHTDSATLLSTISTDVDEQLTWMPVLWHLVAKRRIAVNWDVAFGGVVPLWPEARHHGYSLTTASYGHQERIGHSTKRA